MLCEAMNVTLLGNGGCHSLSGKARASFRLVAVLVVGPAAAVRAGAAAASLPSVPLSSPGEKAVQGSKLVES